MTSKGPEPEVERAVEFLLRAAPEAVASVDIELRQALCKRIDAALDAHRQQAEPLDGLRDGIAQLMCDNLTTSGVIIDGASVDVAADAILAFLKARGVR